MAVPSAVAKETETLASLTVDRLTVKATVVSKSLVTEISLIDRVRGPSSFMIVPIPMSLSMSALVALLSLT